MLWFKFPFHKSNNCFILSHIKRNRHLIYIVHQTYIQSCILIVKILKFLFPLFNKVSGFTKETRSLDFSPILLNHFFNVKMISENERNRFPLVKNVQGLITSLNLNYFVSQDKRHNKDVQLWCLIIHYLE